ncbi:MAG: winged helix-turn-helix domain-containing protein [Candidatus Tectomicrobia bacterium]|nr:winged helix-turn-helix domain-containing protein [Candidatus Tectomicrobia bacterium]
MRRPQPLPEGAAARLRTLLQQARGKGAFQRVQCVWLRAALGLSAAAVALALGWHPSSVRRLQARYLKEGEGCLGVGQRGGRRHENLSVAQEAQLLAGFLATADEGGLLEVSAVQAAYEAAVGHPVPKSTVYRLLARHGWRKLAPRPRHPKADAGRQQAFKKTSPGSSPAP